VPSPYIPAGAYSAIRNINYMKRLLSHPCQTPSVGVMLETAFEAGIPLLYELWQISAWDALAKAGREFLSPYERGVGAQKLRGSIAHGSKLKALKYTAGNPLIVDGTRAFFAFAQPYETAQFYMFLANISTDFAAAWMTQIYEKQGCEGVDCCATIPIVGPVIAGPGATGPVTLGSSGGIQGCVWGGRDILVNGGQNVTITYSVDGSPWPTIPDPPPVWHAELADLGATWDTSHTHQGGTVGVDQNAIGGYQVTNQPGDRHYQVNVIVDSGYLQIDGGSITVSCGHCSNGGPAIPLPLRRLLEI
jgi:hypothetical protein